MKKLIIIILIILSFGLAGCGKKKDINQLILVSSIGIDKTEGGCKIVVQIVNRNILVPNPKDNSPIFTASACGKTVLEALNSLNDILPSRVYLINLQLLVFSEDIAKEGINEYIHLFINYQEAQHEFNVILTKGITAEKFLKQTSVFSIFPTRTFINKLKTAADDYGIAKETFIEKVYDGLVGEYKIVLMSSVIVEGDIEKGENVEQNKTSEIASKILISDLGVFYEGKLIGWLNKEEAIAYNFVTEHLKETVLVVEGKNNNKISSFIKKGKCKIKVSIVNDRPKVQLEIKFEVVVIEDTGLDIKVEKEYQEDIKIKLEELVKQMILDCFNKSKNEIGVDVFGFAIEFYKREPAWWRKNKDNYNEIFKDMDIEIKVTANIQRLEL